MNQTQTVIAAVNPRTTGTGQQLWDVVDGNGQKYTAWEPAQAQQAMAAVGQMGVLTYTEKQNGQYVNRSFKGFTVAPQGATFFPSATPQPDMIGTAVQNGAVLRELPVSQPSAPSDRDAQIVAPDERDARIVRQSAYKAAVELVVGMRNFFYPDDFPTPSVDGILADVRSVTEELVAFGLTGNWGGAGTPPPAAQPVPADASAAPWD